MAILGEKLTEAVVSYVEPCVYEWIECDAREHDTSISRLLRMMLLERYRDKWQKVMNGRINKVLHSEVKDE